MKLLTVYAKSSGFDHLIYPEKEHPIAALELFLREADILFDKEQRAILAIMDHLRSQQIVASPGPKGVGYFQATDDEIDILTKAGYSLPDWRKLTVVDLGHQYPAWNSQ
jgi:hypothetical protein